MKRCYKCGEYKTLNADNFYRDRSRSNGFDNMCKECKKEKDKKRDRREYFNRINKEDPKTIKRRREYFKWYQEKYKDEFNDASRARQAVYRSVKKGDLIRPSICEWCKNEYPIIEAAHHDYDKPLDVKWLCKPCHTKWDYHEPKLIKK